MDSHEDFSFLSMAIYALGVQGWRVFYFQELVLNIEIIPDHQILQYFFLKTECYDSNISVGFQKILLSVSFVCVLKVMSCEKMTNIFPFISHVELEFDIFMCYSVYICFDKSLWLPIMNSFGEVRALRKCSKWFSCSRLWILESVSHLCESILDGSCTLICFVGIRNRLSSLVCSMGRFTAFPFFCTPWHFHKQPLARAPHLMGSAIGKVGCSLFLWCVPVEFIAIFITIVSTEIFGNLNINVCESGNGNTWFEKMVIVLIVWCSVRSKGCASGRRIQRMKSMFINSGS